VISEQQWHISIYYYPGILLERLRKTTKFIGNMSRDFEPGTFRLQVLSVSGALIASVQVLAFTVLLEDWIQLAQDRFQWWALVYTATKLKVPQSETNFLTSCATLSFWSIFHGVRTSAEYLLVRGAGVAQSV
jgi:hypothetical protein